MFFVGRLVSRRCHIIGSIAQVSSDLRYYEGSDSCRVIPQSRSPRLSRLTFLTFHPQPRDAPVHRFTGHFSVYGEFQASPYPSRLAANIPPNQVRHPTDRQFASGCSPPRLTTTQLPSATEPWHAPTRTFTVLIRRPHGRTRARARAIHWRYDSAIPDYRRAHVPGGTYFFTVNNLSGPNLSHRCRCALGPAGSDRNASFDPSVCDRGLGVAA